MFILSMIYRSLKMVPTQPLW